VSKIVHDGVMGVIVLPSDILFWSNKDFQTEERSFWSVATEWLKYVTRGIVTTLSTHYGPH